MMNLPNHPVKTGFNRCVQFAMLPICGKLVRQVIGRFLVTANMLRVCRFQRQVSIAVDAEHHAPVQTKAAADQHGKADRETGPDAKRHK